MAYSNCRTNSRRYRRRNRSYLCFSWILDKRLDALDPNFGTEEDLKELVEKAHQNGIRIVLDAVINHTGPVTYVDPEYPNKWVRTEPNVFTILMK